MANSGKGGGIYGRDVMGERVEKYIFYQCCLIVKFPLSSRYRGICHRILERILKHSGAFNALHKYQHSYFIVAFIHSLYF